MRLHTISLPLAKSTFRATHSHAIENTNRFDIWPTPRYNLCEYFGSKPDVMATTPSATVRHSSARHAARTAHAPHSDTRPPRIATVSVLGDKIMQPAANPARIALLTDVIDAITRRSWRPIDAAVFPGGFLRLTAFIGHLPPNSGGVPSSGKLSSEPSYSSQNARHGHA